MTTRRLRDRETSLTIHLTTAGGIGILIGVYAIPAIPDGVYGWLVVPLAFPAAWAIRRVARRWINRNASVPAQPQRWRT